jgi:hypothetical protein
LQQLDNDDRYDAKVQPGYTFRDPFTLHQYADLMNLHYLSLPDGKKSEIHMPAVGSNPADLTEQAKVMARALIDLMQPRLARVATGELQVAGYQAVILRDNVVVRTIPENNHRF